MVWGWVVRVVPALGRGPGHWGGSGDSRGLCGSFHGLPLKLSLGVAVPSMGCWAR